MTEEELVDLGFEMVHIMNEQSDNGYDYYYYQKELCSGLVLHSTDSIDVKDNNWIIGCWEIPAIKITTQEHFTQFMEMINNITC